MYICCDGVAQPLVPHYTVPCLVVESGQKFFRIYIQGKVEAVSGDRLKPQLGKAGSILPCQPGEEGQEGDLLVLRQATVFDMAGGGGPV